MDELNDMDLGDTTEADGPQIHLERWIATLQNESCSEALKFAIRNRGPARIPEVTPRPFSMPRQSLLLDHLAALPCLRAGEFFLACEAGKAAQGPGVYRALKFLHFSELPAEIRVAKGIAKMDQASFWVHSE